VYAPLIFVTKLSLFLLYLRVFAPSRKGSTYRIIHLFIWFNVAFYLANFFLKIFQCIPRSRIWDPDTPGHCININIPILVTAAINVLSDIMMLVLPIVCVWRLQMTTRRKIGISAIFAAGVLYVLNLSGYDVDIMLTMIPQRMLFQYNASRSKRQGQRYKR